ncbi:HET-domain-containing protein [Lophium mytilinum]|uniref:HET-domain-containing protein n=1 Tax=Lophium mytilinum TaxID=390894 RepID=A0A6A6QQ34_9PEZI|nr:HET-domain-containing protein [Lophium mytilinum]
MLFGTAALSIWYFGPADRNDEAIVYLSIFTFWAMIMFFFDNIKAVATLSGPFIFAALVWAYFAPPKDRAAWVFGIALFPLLFSYAMCGGLIFAVATGMILWAIVSRLSLIFYTCTFRHWIFRLPRYRRVDPFEKSTLCDHCRRVLGRSGLLFGSWIMFVRTKETHRFYATLEEMQRSWRGCPLCEALSSQRLETSTQTNSGISYGNYGTISQRTPSFGLPSANQDEALNVTIKLHRGSSFGKEYGLQFLIRLETPIGPQFKELCIAEGVLEEKPDVLDYTGTLSIIAKIKNWIKECRKHELCKPHTPGFAFIPTRLLYVGTAEIPELRIVLGADLNQHPAPDFVALSHCWGGDIDYKLETTNYPSMTREGIDNDALSKNFQEAVYITRHLGLSYLWIDSLCILQDCEDDWAKESSAMRLVYSNAACVLSATASKDSNGGCFRKRPAPSETWSLVTSGKTRYYLSAQKPSIKTLFDTRVETAPLTKRAWAFQERLLSRRLVHFCSDVVLFECNTMQASEFDEQGSRYEKLPYVVHNGRLFDWVDENILTRLLSFAGFSRDNYIDRSASRGVRGALDVLKSLGAASGLGLREQIEFNQRWYSLVFAYSEGALTYPTDKLVAISGIAELVQDRAQTPYLAGLWSSVFVELGLLWRVRHLEKKQPLYCAPSWSWASVNGRVDLLPYINFGDVKFKAENIIVEMTVNQMLVSSKGENVIDSRGLVDAGLLDVTGPVSEVSLLKPRHRTRFDTGKHRLKFSGSQDDKILDFFPDWLSDDSTSIETGSKQGQLVALRVLTIPRTDLRAQTYGLVLRTENALATLPEFQRVGVFSAVKEAGPWTRQTIRII